MRWCRAGEGLARLPGMDIDWEEPKGKEKADLVMADAEMQSSTLPWYDSPYFAMLHVY